MRLRTEGARSTERARGNRLVVKFSQTPSLVGGNRSVDDRSAVNAFPGIENEKEVRKPLHHHQAFAFRTIHSEPPNLVFCAALLSEYVDEPKQFTSPKLHYSLKSMSYV